MLAIFIICPVTLLVGLFSIIVSLRAKLVRGCVFGVFLCIIGGICLTGILTENAKKDQPAETQVVSGSAVSKYDWELIDNTSDTVDSSDLHYADTNVEGEEGEEGTPSFDFIEDSEVVKYVPELEKDTMYMGFEDETKPIPTTIMLDGVHTTTQALISNIQSIREQHYKVHINYIYLGFTIKDRDKRYAVLTANVDDDRDEDTANVLKQNFKLYADMTQVDLSDKDLIGHTVEFTIEESALSFVRNTEADETNYIELGIPMSVPVLKLNKDTHIKIE